jgi:hypothetical protein
MNAGNTQSPVLILPRVGSALVYAQTYQRGFLAFSGKEPILPAAQLFDKSNEIPVSPSAEWSSHQRPDSDQAGVRRC